MTGDGWRDVLAPREWLVLKLKSEGLNAMEIGDRLGRSPATVRKQISMAILKLHANNSTHAVAIAMRNGWLDDDEQGGQGQEGES